MHFTHYFCTILYSSFISIIQLFSSWFKLLKFMALCLHCQMRFVMRRKELKQNVMISAKASSVELLAPSELEKAKGQIIMFDPLGKHVNLNNMFHFNLR